MEYITFTTGYFRLDSQHSQKFSGAYKANQELEIQKTVKGEEGFHCQHPAYLNIEEVMHTLAKLSQNCSINKASHQVNQLQVAVL